MGKANRVAEGTLGQLRLGPRQVAKEVTLWPLVLPLQDCPPGPELWPLEEALEDGFVAILAAAEPGRVRIESRAPAPVWIAAGEPLGAAGRAAESTVLGPHGGAPVDVLSGGPSCDRCCGAFAEAFHGAEDQVGFVLSVHDRAVGLELVLAPGLLTRRLRHRVAAWAPWLLGLEARGEDDLGLESPEALLAALRSGHPLGGARVALVWPGGSRSAWSLPM